MYDREKKEQEIMNQEMSTDEMETVAEGQLCTSFFVTCLFGHADKECDDPNMTKYGRQIHKPDGTVNCANTVEDGSHCDVNDACYDNYVRYMSLVNCSKAWQ